MLEVQLLGPVRVVRDGQPRRLAGRRPLAVLVALALDPGALVSVDGLVDRLWADDPPRQARANLQTYVSKLRAVVGDEAVVHERGGYRLELAPEATDLGRVEAAVARARARSADDPRRAAAELADALGCWRGPALADLRDEVGFAADVARLDELERTLTDEVADALLAAGAPDEALPLARRAVAADPLRERSTLVLVRALHAAGRPADAMRAAAAYRRALGDETGLVPGPELEQLEHRIASGAGPEPPLRPSPQVATPSIPTPATTPVTLPRSGRFVGRTGELEALGAALGAHRLVSVVGPGGVGKTRLVAEALAARDDRPVIVELASAGSGQVGPALAAALRLSISDADAVAAVTDYLGEHPGLVVLDNCEHVAAEVRDLVARLLVAAPATRLLVTSRSRLDVADEHVVALGPLHVDDSAGDGGPAVELFLDRLSTAAPGAAPDPARVAQICRRLDGLPLAVELAASRAAELGVDAVADRLEALLLWHTRDDDRHASLGALVDWSAQLLDDDAVRLLEALSVFAGGITVGSAEQVGAAVGVRRPAAALARLVGSSLVVADPISGRCRLLETVRVVARDRLAGAGGEEAALDAHLAWTADLLAGAATTIGPAEVDAVATVDAERPNVRTAVRRALRGCGTDVVERLAGDLARVHLYRADTEVLGWLRSLGEVAERRADGGATVIAAAARAAFLAGELDRSRQLAHRALDRGATGTGAHLAHHALGVAGLYAGDLVAARAWFGRDLDAAAPDAVLDALGGLALAHCYAGQLAEAEAVLDEHAQLADGLGSPTYRAFGGYVAAELAVARDLPDVAATVSGLRWALGEASSTRAEFVAGLIGTTLVSVLARVGRAEEALREVPELLDRFERAGTRPQLWTTLRWVAGMLAGLGRAGDAALLLAAADADPAAPAVTGADAERIDAVRAELRRHLGDDGLARIERTARRLPRGRVVDRALHAIEELLGPAR